MNNNSAKTLFDNKTYVFMTECLSTNDYLLKLLKKKNYEEGTMINTSYQKGGRGQRNNEWLSEKGKNLTFSFNWLFSSINSRSLVSILSTDSFK